MEGTPPKKRGTPPKKGGTPIHPVFPPPPPQTQQAKFVNWQVDGEYRGADFTAAVTLGNPDILVGSGKPPPPKKNLGDPPPKKLGTPLKKIWGLSGGISLK